MANPLLNQTTPLPRFSLIKPKHILEAINQTLAGNKNNLQNLLHKNTLYTWQNLIAPFLVNEDRLNKIWSIANHLNNVANSKDLRRVYKICLPKISTHHIELQQNSKLYKAVSDIAKSPAFINFSSPQKKVIENMLRDFRLAGASLNKKQQQHLKLLQRDLVTLQNKFSENVLDATNAWHKLITDRQILSGLPAYALDAAKENAARAKKNGWLLDLQAPCFAAVITYADNRKLRREIYIANITKASFLGEHAKKFDNSQNIVAILKDRYKISHLLNFKNYAELSLATILHNF